jgi:hypothetical protein
VGNFKGGNKMNKEEIVQEIDKIRLSDEAEETYDMIENIEMLYLWKEEIHKSSIKLAKNGKFQPLQEYNSLVNTAKQQSDYSKNLRNRDKKVLVKYLHLIGLYEYLEKTNKSLF